jgi:hypothetical protein
MHLTIGIVVVVVLLTNFTISTRKHAAPIPCKMTQQASLHNHNISRKARFHDHIVCVIQAIEYSMQVGPPQEAQ